MENKLTVWPPAPLQAQINVPVTPQPLKIIPAFLGLLVGLVYWSGVWWEAYQFSVSAGPCWQLQLPLGLLIPNSSAFVIGFVVGFLLLLLLLIVLRRSLRDFGKGLTIIVLPIGLMCLFVIFTYLCTPKGF